MVRKTAHGWQVLSEEGKPLSADNLTKEEADKRLAEIEYFKTHGAKDSISEVRSVYRIDRGTFGKVEKTAQGGMRVPAYLTRTGVFTYRTDDGKVLRELRTPEEVFRPDSLATLNDATLTDLHPGRVTPKTYKAVSIGHVQAGSVKADGIYIAANVLIQDADAVSAVERGDRSELSCGYTCDSLFTPGEYQGEKYDAVQTNIRYNHVALLPKNEGRAGNAVALHLDAGDAIQDMSDVIVPPEVILETEVLDGITYKVGSSEHIQALRKIAQDAKGRADSLAESLATEKARADKAEGERDAARSDAAAAPAKYAAQVTASNAIDEKAAKVLGTAWKRDGKSDREVMIAAIVKTDAAFIPVATTSDEYLRGRFDNLSANVSAAPAQTRADAMIAQGGGSTGPVNGVKKTPAQVREASRREAQDAWKKPLTISKDAR